MSPVEPTLHPLIIPTVLIPLTAISVMLSSVAVFIAGLFGIHLKAEGPKKLLEVLLKPRVIASALALNLVMYGAVKGFDYVRTLPSFLWTIEFRQSRLAKESSRTYTDALEQAPPAATEASASRGPGLVLREVWSQKIRGGSFRGAVISGESLFVGTEKGRVEELNLADGADLRSFFVGGTVSPAPVIYKGYLYAGEGTHDTHHARIYKYDLKTGAFVAAYATKGHTEGQPIIASVGGKTLLLAVAGADGVHALDPETMERAWSQRNGHADGSVRVKDGIAFSGSGREKADALKDRSWATAYEFATGKVLWKHELPGSSWMAPFFADDDVCFVHGEVYFPSEVGGFVCFDRHSGESGRSFYHSAPLVATPIVLGSDVILTDFYGQVCRVSLKSLTRTWCTETDHQDYTLADPTYDPKRGVLYFPSQKAGLFVINAKDGAVVARWSPAGDGKWPPTTAPALLTERGLVVADDEGLIRLLEISDEQLAQRAPTPAR